jgi:hypothetical protein
MRRLYVLLILPLLCIVSSCRPQSQADLDAAVPAMESFFQWLFVRAETPRWDQLEVRGSRKGTFMEDLWANMEGDRMHFAIGRIEEKVRTPEELEAIEWRFYHYEHEKGAFTELSAQEVAAYDERTLDEARKVIQGMGTIHDDPYAQYIQALLLSMNRWPHALIMGKGDTLDITVGAGNVGWGIANFQLVRKDGILRPQGPIEFADNGP